MVTQTTAYIVPFDKLKRAVGSKDPKLLASILDEYDWMLEEIDGNRKDDETLTSAEVVEQLINGDDLSEVPRWQGYLYGWTMEVLCAALGEFGSEISGEWCDELDTFFADREIPLPFSDIVNGDGVLALPVSDDCPYIGSWSPTVVTAAAVGIAAINLDELRDEDEEMAEVVAEVKTWVEMAAKRPGWGVIGFSF